MVRLLTARVIPLFPSYSHGRRLVVIRLNVVKKSSESFGEWLGREDSNLRMQEPKSCVLPLDDAPGSLREYESLGGAGTRYPRENRSYSNDRIGNENLPLFVLCKAILGSFCDDGIGKKSENSWTAS
jgi:hypothetical protein